MFSLYLERHFILLSFSENWNDTILTEIFLLHLAIKMMLCFYPTLIQLKISVEKIF